MKVKTKSSKNVINSRITSGINRIKTAKNQERFAKLNKDILSLYDESISKEGKNYINLQLSLSFSQKNLLKRK